MEREQEYQDTEIGRIPKEWKVVRLGEVLVEADVRLRECNEGAEQLPVLSLTKNDGLILQTERFGKRIATEDLSDYKVVRRGQIVNNPYVIWEGAVHILSKYDAGLVSPVYQVWESVLDKADPWFIDRLLRMPATVAAYNRFATGAVNRRRAIRKTDFLNIPLPLPPLPEQKKIAEILRAVDEAIEKTDKAIEQTERLKKGLMQELLTKGIGHEEFQDTEIGRIPKEWKALPLGDDEVCDDIFYGITAKATEDKTELKILRTTDIKDYTVDWSNLTFCEITEKRSTIDRYILKKGDIIVARSGTVGVSVLVDKDFDDVIFGSYLIKVRLKPEIDPKFVHYFMQSSSYWKHIQKAQGSTLKNINLPILRSLVLPLPPLPEQKKITEILRAVDRKIELLRRKKEVLGRLKKGLMGDLLTGKVRVVKLLEKEAIENGALG